MKTIHLTLGGLGLLSAIIILAISVVSVNQVISYEGTQASCKQFYLGETILPDHVLYPVVAGLDRGLLLASPPSKKLTLRVSYGWIRYDYALGLLEKENKPMALSALTKSQKYFNLAAHHALQQDLSSDQVKFLINNLQDHLEVVAGLANKFTDDQRAIISQINDQNQSLLEQLQERF